MKELETVKRSEASDNRVRARDRGHPQYLGQPCRSDHIHENSLARGFKGSARYTSTGACVTCTRAKTREQRTTPTALAKDRDRKRAQRDRDASIAYL